MSSTAQDSAQRIAERGRETLRARLREAFEEAAAEHADVLELDEGKLERMIERAVERADGLQWRRALASAATQELGIGLGEALAHPAVVDAQRLVGAPSYEEGLAAIAEGRSPEPGGAADGSAEADARSPGEGQARAAREGDENTAGATTQPDVERESVDIRVSATHVGGLTELDDGDEVTLVFSEEGLEIVRGQSGARVVRYDWSELRRIHVRSARRILRRSAYPRVTVVAGGAESRFEVAGVDGDWLERRLAPAQARLAAGG